MPRKSPAASPLRSRITGLDYRPARELQDHQGNWRTHPQHQRDALAGVLHEVGIVGALLVYDSPRQGGLTVIDGHLRKALYPDEPWPCLMTDLDDPEADYVLANLDWLTYQAGADRAQLEALLAQVSSQEAAVEANLARLRQQFLDDPLPGGAAGAEGAAGVAPLSHPGALAERFLIPPFSVLDARQAPWKARKRAWRALGLTSELGRGQEGDKTERQALVYGPPLQTYAVQDAKRAAEARDGRRYTWPEFLAAYPAVGAMPGDSIFDPVLCEVVYRWFSPPAAAVLDPFAGGSVRGLVAAALGRRYHGIDLSAKQVAANQDQWQALQPQLAPLLRLPATHAIGDPEARTPIEAAAPYWLKRDDLFGLGGATGQKVRAILALAPGASGLVTCGSRQSTQIERCALVAAALGLPCRVHTASGEETPQTALAAAAGAEVLRHQPGRLSVLKARAAEDAEARGWCLIPWALEHEAAVRTMRAQVPPAFPDGVRRLVICAGSGMSLAGLLWGLRDHGQTLPVLAVQVGGALEARLDRYAPDDWRQRVEIVPAAVPYEQPCEAQVGDVVLDPIYEAKCAAFLQPGDLLWLIGGRLAPPAAPAPAWQAGDSRALDELLAPDYAADLLFSCPPYADLERYSDDARDLSTMAYPAFLEAYRAILAAAARRLKPDRFACLVVADVRDGHGAYRNFVGDTVEACRAAGLALYNDAILLSPLGSAPMRAAGYFGPARKLVKVHQNVLVFVKGDARAATAACGPPLGVLPHLEAALEAEAAGQGDAAATRPEP